MSSTTRVAEDMGAQVSEAILHVIRFTAEGIRCQFFDMENDPFEYENLGSSAEHQEILTLMYDRLAIWARRLSQRTTKSDAQIIAERGRSPTRGITLGIYGESEIPLLLTQFYRGKLRPAPSD